MPDDMVFPVTVLSPGCYLSWPQLYLTSQMNLFFHFIYGLWLSFGLSSFFSHYVTERDGERIQMNG